MYFIYCFCYCPHPHPKLFIIPSERLDDLEIPQGKQGRAQTDRQSDPDKYTDIATYGLNQPRGLLSEKVDSMLFYPMFFKEGHKS